MSGCGPEVFLESGDNFGSQRCFHGVSVLASLFQESSRVDIPGFSGALEIDGYGPCGVVCASRGYLEESKAQQITLRTFP
jgi:hypothetical protein